MTARDYLERYKQAQTRADRLKEDYQELVEKYDAVGGSTFTDYQHTGISKPTERKVERAMAAREKWAEAECSAIEIRQELFDLINKIEEPASTLLWQRYLNGLTWDKVAEYIDRGLTQTHRLHGKALQQLQDIIDSK